MGDAIPEGGWPKSELIGLGKENKRWVEKGSGAWNHGQGRDQ